jgi:uncharacterized membrane protein
MNKLGILSGIFCVLLSLLYDWQITLILIFYFIATKTDTVIFVEQKVEDLLGKIKQ